MELSLAVPGGNGTFSAFSRLIMMTTSEGETVPPLIRYVITRMSIGFALGAGTAMALIVFSPEAIGSPSGLLEICMIVYGLGSTFAAGYLGTALAMDA